MLALDRGYISIYILNIIADTMMGVVAGSNDDHGDDAIDDHDKIDMIVMAIYICLHTYIRNGSRIFQRGVTIHCLITKICELGACFLYFFYVLA